MGKKQNKVTQYLMSYEESKVSTNTSVFISITVYTSKHLSLSHLSWWIDAWF